MSTPIESIMAMFLMSMTNFGEYYNAFSRTEHEYVAKVCTIIDLLTPFNTVAAVTVRDIHGDSCHIAGQHVDRHDGQHVPENSGDEERMAAPGEFRVRILKDRQRLGTVCKFSQVDQVEN